MNECWMNGFLKYGLYYEGIASSVDGILELYKRQTVTTWGTRISILKVIKLHLPILGVKKKQQ